MTMNTTRDQSILTPAEVSNLVVTPLTQDSLAMQASTVVQSQTHEYRIPVVQDDPSASWVEEGEDISTSDQDLKEVTVTPRKVAGLTIITRELADDSTPEAATTVGKGLVRDLTRKVDEAFFGDLDSPAPSGLESLSNVHETSVSSWEDLDPFAEAINNAEAHNAKLNTFVTNPDTALKLAQLKIQEGSNQPLLGMDATESTDRQILGVRLLVSPYVADETVWGIDAEYVTTVIRRGGSNEAELVRDDSRYFESDRVALRAIMRVGFGFPHEKSIQKIILNES